MAEPLRPMPNASDYAEALVFIRETYCDDPNVSRKWIANNADNLIRYAADAAMQKRLEAERQQAIAQSKQRRAA